MRHKTVMVAAALLTLSGGTAVQGHHSIAGVYDSARSVRFEAIVVAFRFVSPHPFVEVDVRAPDGTVERWRLEMDNRFELTAEGMTAETLKAGDRVTVTGSGARDGGRGAYVRQLVRPSDGFSYEQVGSRPRVRLP